MHEDEALRIVLALADGVDPNTGEALAECDWCQHPQIIRALYVAAGELDRRVRRLRRAERLPAHAGKPWRDDEDEALRSGVDGGSTVKELSDRHQRTPGAIKRRLEKLGIETVRGDRSPRPLASA